MVASQREKSKYQSATSSLMPDQKQPDKDSARTLEEDLAETREISHVQQT
jgi:hypothetical protein